MIELLRLFFVFSGLTLRRLFSHRQHKSKAALQTQVGGYRVYLNEIKAEKNLGLEGLVNMYLANGPLDRIAGFFNSSNGRIEIDVLEIFLAYKPSNKQELDDKITQTVCHECRHAWQLKKIGKWFFFIRILLYVTYFFMYFSYIHIFLGFLGQEPAFLGYAIMFLLDLVVAVVTGFIISYYFSPAEIDARRFARSNYNKPEWKDVIIVEEAEGSNGLFTFFNVNERLKNFFFQPKNI